MKNTKRHAVIGTAVLGLCLAGSVVTRADAQDNAVQAATAWVALVDAGQYGESWETAAVLFKNATAKKQWEQTLAAVRKPLGKLVSRELKSKTYKESLPGAPDGQYVIIQFATSFANKKSGIETVTPMLDKDGQWRVSGYYIQ